jgi:hypothetical protein
MTAQDGIGTRPTRIRVGSASKPSATARRATYFELSRPLLEPCLATAPGRTACILIHDRPARDALCRDELRRTAASADGSATRTTDLCHEAGAADAYSADAPEPPPRSWSQRVAEARCQDARTRRYARLARHDGGTWDRTQSWAIRATEPGQYGDRMPGRGGHAPRPGVFAPAVLAARAGKFAQPGS